MAGTLSYDVTGYYLYLPAAFIYKDLKQFSYEDTLKSSTINVDTNMGRWSPNGAYVLQYTCGMALMYMPFFAIAHTWASLDSAYLNNGFSLPYQSLIYFGSLLIAFIGIYYLRKILLQFFEDKIVALVLLSMCIGTNYLTYASINAAMSHNYLFTLYCILIFYVINFYKKPNYKSAIIIGITAGLAILTRPTEILILIPFMFWNTNIFSKKALIERFQYFLDQKKYYISIFLIIGLIGITQLAYWYYVTGSIVNYSYGDQTFSFLSPHIYKCLFSTQAGWIVYSPLVLFAMVGCYTMYKEKKQFSIPILMYLLLFMYVCFSWDIWWYGGSLGQRAMVQSYPFWAIAMGYFYANAFTKKYLYKAITVFLFVLFMYLNLWYTHMAANGGMLSPPTVTTAYLSKIIGTWKKNTNDLKLLDTNEEYTGELINPKTIYTINYDSIGGIRMNDSLTYSETELIKLYDTNNDWYRVSVVCSSELIEWTWWNHTQLIVKFYNNDKEIKSKFIRLQRHISDASQMDLYIDVKAPKANVNAMKIVYYNPGSNKELVISSMAIQTFNED
jgi:hypothetical protein